MRSLYKSILNGTARSRGQGNNDTKVTFTNGLAFKVQVSWIDSEGNLVLRNFVEPDAKAIYQGSRKGYIYLFTDKLSGAFVGAYEQTQDTAVPIAFTIDQGIFCLPNEIGSPPAPTADCIIPRDSQAIVVGSGILSKNASVTVSVARTQYWRLTGESISLAANESRELIFSERTGLQRTSTDESTTSSSMGASAGGGWGPISVSLSASLSASSTTMQQVVITKETESDQKFTLPNNSAATAAFLRWQMMDIITIFKNTLPVSSIVQGLAPTIVSDPYDPSKLPPAAPRTFDPSVIPPKLVPGSEMRHAGRPRKQSKRAASRR